MARKPNKAKKGKAVRVHLILPGELVVKIDAEAKRLASRSRGSEVTRSDVVRRALYGYRRLYRGATAE